MIATGPGWEMRRGDCIEGMRQLADRSVDVSISDAPYDEHTHAKGRRGSSIAAKYGAREQRDAATRAAVSRNRSLGFDAITATQMAAVAAEWARLVRRWVLVFCTVEMVSDWKRHLEGAGLRYVRTCVWHKLGSTPQFTGDRPAQAVEAIVCAHQPGRTRWNAGGKHGYYAHPIVLERGNGEVRLHTTQKPISLMRELVQDFTDTGEIVLDSYAGSATTLLACSQLSRRSVGFELAACARCPSLAVWSCTWQHAGKPHAEFLCDAHREQVSAFERFAAHRDNYFDIACRRLRGDEARPRREQPGLFDALGGTP